MVVRVLVACAIVLVGCKQQPPAPKAEAPAVKPPPPPPAPPAEPRAAPECAAPIDLKPATNVKIGERDAVAEGYRLSFSAPDADGQLKLGVLGPINEDSGPNMLVLKKYLKFFGEEKVDALVVTGDVGEVADGIARVLKALAATKLPVFVIAGNRECRGEYADGVQAAQKDFSNIVNMNEVRAVAFPEATLVSLPGYHDPNYITCANGCRYFKTTVDEVIRVAKEAKGPVVLVGHGPPRGEGSQALDYASAGGNVGDPEVRRALEEGKIAFGTFSNIKEAGARATDLAGTQIKQDAFSKALYLNPGPADTVGWEMNDGSKSSGLAAVLTLKGDEAAWKLYRAKPMTNQEKAQAKALAPPPRTEIPAEQESAAPADAAAARPTPPAGVPHSPSVPKTP
jgi:Icc-related predicted phosphoesterase